MSLYKTGIVGAEVAPAATLASAAITPKPPGSGWKPGVWSIAAVLGGIGAIWYLGSRKPAQQGRGPDMSDVEARLRAQGRDPGKYW